MDRLQPQEMKKTNIQRPYIRFIPSEKAPGKILLKIEGVEKGYGELEVIHSLTKEISRGDKIGVIGNNGRGKTTLLKMLAGVMAPDKGKIETGHQVLISYFPQNHADIVDKSGSKTAFDWLKERKPGIYDQDIRSVMGKMLFGGDDAFMPVATLSGGGTTA